MASALSGPVIGFGFCLFGVRVCLVPFWVSSSSLFVLFGFFWLDSLLLLFLGLFCCNCSIVGVGGGEGLFGFNIYIYMCVCVCVCVCVCWQRIADPIMGGLYPMVI